MCIRDSVCTELEFSISAVNRSYGESDGAVIVGEFDLGSKFSQDNIVHVGS